MDERELEQDSPGHPIRRSWLGYLAIALLIPVAVSLTAPRTAADDEGQQAARFASEIAVDVVTVDVVVTDRRDRPILDLERGDFEVFEDEKRMEITNFLAVVPPAPADARPARTPEAEPPAAKEGEEPRGPEGSRYLMLYVDHVFMHSQSLRRLRPRIQDFIRDQVPEGTWLALVSYDGAVDVRVPFTKDRERMIEILETEFSRAGHADLMESFEGMQLESWIWGQSVAAGDPDLAALVAEERQASLDALAEDYRSLIRRSWRSLQFFVDSCAGLPGRKVILHISDGVPYRPDHWNSPGRNTSGVGNRAPRPESFPRELSDVVAHAASLGVTIHTVYGEGGSRGQATGQVISPEVSGRVAAGTADLIREQRFNTQVNTTSTLQILAEGTGGVAVLKPTAENLEPLGTDVRAFYSIGYRPPTPGDGARHAIKVEVKRKGARVRHRESYIALAPRELVAAKTLSALVVPETDNPLGIEWVVTAPGRAEGDSFILPIDVLLPSRSLSLQPSGDSWVGHLRVYVVSMDLTGTIGPFVDTLFPVSMPEPPEHGSEVVYRMPVEVALARGQHTVAVTVLDELSGLSSSSAVVLVVDGTGGVWRVVKKIEPAAFP
jgi:VWFA-related protein